MEAVFENVCKVFGFQGLNEFQIEAITHILEKGIDIFVNLRDNRRDTANL